MSPYRLAASIMADEDGSLTTKASASAATFPFGEEDADEYEEIVLPAMHSRVDPAVLAALPPSMQLDLLVQMRERLMAENRQKYQKVKKAPEKFSELQIQSYLKTVAFRREINQLQKAASGKGVGGVQTSRIASEANREFIFSSSFTGDKQLLTSAEVHRHGEKQQQPLKEHPASLSVDSAALIGSNTITGFVQDEPMGVFDDDVETYTDERGRTCISRLRAMGIRMTGDLQRNLDLMKKMEKENTDAIKAPCSEPELNDNTLTDPECRPSGKQHEKGLHGDNGDSASLDERNAQSMCNCESSIRVSFEVDGESKCLDSDDEMFACLLAGKPIDISSANKSTSRRQSSNSCSDSDWEERIVEENGNHSSNDDKLGHKPPLEESNISDDSEVEWEEGVCDVHENFLVPDQSRKHVSRGHLEEEADLQEAIRRSLEDTANGNDAISEHKKLNVCGAVGFCDPEDTSGEKDASKLNKSDTDILAAKKLDTVGESNVCITSASRQGHLKTSELPTQDNLLINKPHERDLGSYFRQSSCDWNKEGRLCSKMPSADLVAPLEAKEVNLIVEQSASTFVEGRQQFASTKTCSGDAFNISKAASGNLPNAMVTDDDKNSMEAEPSMMVNEEKIGLEAPPSVHSLKINDPSTSFVQQSAKDSESGSGYGEKLSWKKVPHDKLTERHSCMGKSAPKDNENVQINFSDVRLEEEMLILGQEFVNLEDEQRKLERNAESVSSEMFAECQELLQMFGIPYIIAPMEAEAQCADMEVANLVDGVVTDDSDVFLFGARSVYKNIFDDRKYVETYLMKDIEKELGLTREKLIRMALLLGSDYTEGVSGIGIVNAIEVVNAFPEEDGLHKFREWIESPDPTILGKLDVEKGINTRKKAAKVVDDDFNGASSNIEAIPSSDQNSPKAHENEHSAYQIQEIKQIFMDKHRNVSKNWHIPSCFPSGAVISAYSSPQVDRSTDPFTWARPDLRVLHRLCWEKFGWSIQKTDELLLPVLKEYDKRETQLRIEAFYTFNERFAKIRSKRIKKAVKGITGNQSADLMDDTVEGVSKKRKRRMSPGKSGVIESGKSKKAGETVPDEVKTVERSSKKHSRKRSIGEPVSYGVQTLKQKGQGGRMHAKKGPLGNERARRRGTSLRTGQESIRGGLHSEQSDSSSSDVGDIEHEVHTVNSKWQQGVRRSARSRKTVSYTERDVETDDMEESEDWSNKERPDHTAAEQGLCWDQGSCGDATTGLDGKKPEKAKDSSVEDLSPDYPERRGFCTGEAEVGQPAVSQTSFKVNDSKDYLKIGGGFCMDENEGGEGQDAAHNLPAATVAKTIDSSPFCGSSEETEYGSGSVQLSSSTKGTKNELVDEGKTLVPVTEHNMNLANAPTGDLSKADGSLPHGAKSGTGASGVVLHAMPNLKRKWRKI
uniref:DNA repair protein UVH3 isoform X3 n=1 Tax=Rhizophora mucronata TaxID=61149 RepID=A0A2P2KUP0_RHIMU